MNGYFQLMLTDQGTAIRLVPPDENGEKISIAELMEYLQNQKIEKYDIKGLNGVVINLKEETVVPLLSMTIPPVSETFKILISEDKMEATVRFYPPSFNNGEGMQAEEIIEELKQKKVTYGIIEDALIDYVWSRVYCTDIIVAKGTPPEESKDAEIIYHFNANLSSKPQRNDDGSVNFFQLNTINHCRKGDLLAKLIPAVRGEQGTNVVGEPIKPRDVKNLKLNYSRNITISEDKTEIYSNVDGHVRLVDNTVFVSDVYEVNNVGTATGNIESEGSVMVKGNVQSGFSIKARGNVHVKGIVEGATIEAGGDVIIDRGMNGMGKGVIHAGGRIIAKFFENAKEVFSGEYIEADSIIHSHVQARTEINVDGRKGFIAGGSVKATNKITCKVLGSAMGAGTVVEVGLDPAVKGRFQEVQKEILAIKKKMNEIQPILSSATQKLKQGGKFNPQQLQYIQTLTSAVKQMQVELKDLVTEYEELDKVMENKEDAYISIRKEGYPGVKVSISNATLVLKNEVQYCRLINDKGEIRVAAF